MKIFVGIVQSKPELVTEPGVTRQFCNVLDIADGHLFKAYLPALVNNSVLPDRGTKVLVFRENDFVSQIISILESSLENISHTPRNFDVDGKFDAGELQIESNGGSYLYLDNNGNVALSDSSTANRLDIDCLNNKVSLTSSNVEITNTPSSNTTKVETLSTLVSRSSINILPNQDIEIKVAPVTPTPSLVKTRIYINSLTGQIDISVQPGGAQMLIDMLGNISFYGTALNIGNTKLVDSTGQGLMKDIIDMVNSYKTHVHANYDSPGIVGGVWQTSGPGTSVTASSFPAAAAPTPPTGTRVVQTPVTPLIIVPKPVVELD